MKFPIHAMQQNRQFSVGKWKTKQTNAPNGRNEQIKSKQNTNQQKPK